MRQRGRGSGSGRREQGGGPHPSAAGSDGSTPCQRTAGCTRARAGVPGGAGKQGRARGSHHDVQGERHHHAAGRMRLRRGQQHDSVAGPAGRRRWAGSSVQGAAGGCRGTRSRGAAARGWAAPGRTPAGRAAPGGAHRLRQRAERLAVAARDARHRLQRRVRHHQPGAAVQGQVAQALRARGGGRAGGGRGRVSACAPCAPLRPSPPRLLPPLAVSSAGSAREGTADGALTLQASAALNQSGSGSRKERTWRST